MDADQPVCSICPTLRGRTSQPAAVREEPGDVARTASAEYTIMDADLLRDALGRAKANAVTTRLDADADANGRSQVRSWSLGISDEPLRHSSTQTPS